MNSTKKKAIFNHKRVAIDFDGTLFHDEGNVDVSFEKGIVLIPMEGAEKTTQWLKSLNFEILIFTCRPDYHRKYMESLLNNANIAYDYILFYTKPRVDLYIDDKGFRFESWENTHHWIESSLKE